MPSARSLPWKLPVASVTFALRMAVNTSCAARPAARKAAGFSRTRTAGFSAPLICTWLTPSIWLSRCPRMVSAASYTWPGDSVSEVSASAMIGASAGLNLR